MPAAAFAAWLTGLPASGKSAIARELARKLHQRGVCVAHLESDVLRTQITPFPGYDEAERDAFYAALAHLGEFLCRQGRSVVFDATANRRAYRDAARRAIPRFAEILVDTPERVCAERDPKGLYRAASEGRARSLPGVQAVYERPVAAEIMVSGAGARPEDAADAIVAWLQGAGWLEARPG